MANWPWSNTWKLFPLCWETCRRVTREARSRQPGRLSAGRAWSLCPARPARGGTPSRAITNPGPGLQRSPSTPSCTAVSRERVSALISELHLEQLRPQSEAAKRRGGPSPPGGKPRVVFRSASPLLCGRPRPQQGRCTSRPPTPFRPNPGAPRRFRAPEQQQSDEGSPAGEGCEPERPEHSFPGREGARGRESRDPRVPHGSGRPARPRQAAPM